MNKIVAVGPLAALSLALVLSSCSVTIPAAEPLPGPSSDQPLADERVRGFTGKVTSDLVQFVDAGKTWAVPEKGDLLFAGNKGVSVGKADKTADIQIKVLNLDDGSTLGQLSIGRVEKADDSDHFPITQRIIRHEGKYFLALTQTGLFPEPGVPAEEDDYDVKVSFVDLDNPTSVIEFEKENAAEVFDYPEPDPDMATGIKHLVAISGNLGDDDTYGSFYATPEGIKQVEGSDLGTVHPVALSQGEPLLEGLIGIGETELRTPGGWDVVGDIGKNDEYPLGELDMKVIDDNYLAFDYDFAIEKPYHGSYLVDLKARKVTQTSHTRKRSDDFGVAGLRNSVEGDFLILKDSAYDKQTGALVDFGKGKKDERVSFAVANRDGTRAYGTMGKNRDQVLVDLTTKKIRKVGTGGSNVGELPVWITSKNTVVFRDSGNLYGVITK